MLRAFLRSWLCPELVEEEASPEDRQREQEAFERFQQKLEQVQAQMRQEWLEEYDGHFCDGERTIHWKVEGTQH